MDKANDWPASASEDDYQLSETLNFTCAKRDFSELNARRVTIHAMCSLD